MVSKKYGENEIRMMFSSFGQIEECRILRGPDGQSRGRCAFSVGTECLCLTADTLSVAEYIFSSSIYTGPSLLLHLKPPHSQNQVLFTSSSTHSFPIVYPPATVTLPASTAKGHCTRCPAQWPVALATAGCRCSWAQLAGGSAQLSSAPPLPPPSSHSTKAGISLSSHLLRSSQLHKASDSRRHEPLVLMYTIHS